MKQIYTEDEKRYALKWNRRKKVTKNLSEMLASLAEIAPKIENSEQNMITRWSKNDQNFY